MKKNILILIVCLFLVGVFATTYNIQLVGADSGFDSSYGGGGSFGSSSSGSGGSFGGGSFSGGEWTDEDTDLMIIFIILIAALILLYYIGKFFINKICNTKFIIKLLNKLMNFDLDTFIFVGLILIFILGVKPVIFIIIPFIIRFIVKYLKNPNKKTNKKITTKDIINLLGKDFDIQKIKKQAFDIYKELQIAWMNFDYAKIKELVNDEMYNMYTNQLETLKIKNQQNIMDEIELISCEIIDCYKSNNKYIFKFYMIVQCYDYIINTKDKILIRGYKNKKLALSYILTFEKNIEVVEFCPKCGATINNLTECEYCKSKIVNNTSRMKLTKKEIKNQIVQK